ncbi:MAG: peptide-N-glycosidase F-related protein [Pseudomonadota bacterium]|nr:peptide-N-glycosidase F-related protein [Pseudomonadota bacterium]
MSLRLVSFSLLGLLGCGDKEADGVDSANPVEDDTAVDPLTTFCADNGFGVAVPWDAVGPYGDVRHALAEDFEVPLADGTAWVFSEHWTGCESYLFIPDTLTRSPTDDRSIWLRDLDDLVAGSPRNTHYFFVSAQRDEAAEASIAGMVEEVEDVLADLSPEEATWWSERLHVVGVPAKDLGNWVESVILRGIGTEGIAVDRFQQIRGMGSFADVTRYDAALSAAGQWPFESNLAYAAHEARFFEMEAARQARLDAVDATTVPLWTGEVISQYADMEVELPSAADMATFDTFEIDVDMRCPEAEAAEPGNCGAWDYIAHLSVQDADGSWVELSRFITTYHREARWVVDATPMMAHLLGGGPRTFRWEWAPEWNVQPTETRLSLRFSDQAKGYKPRAATLVATGGSLGSTYNDGRVPVDVPVSATAAKVELWAIISGHGASTNQCAEFCDHQHEFTVGGESWLSSYPEASTEDGCVDRIEDQMTPNQSGTWWYGRGGWCPGAPVWPFAVDVTAEVVGGTATVGYRGLYDGDTAPDGSGDISMNAWLVVYE